MLSGRWHASHFCWKIGAISLVNVGVLAASAAPAGIADTSTALQASAIDTRNITGSFRPRFNPNKRTGHYKEDRRRSGCLDLSHFRWLRRVQRREVSAKSKYRCPAADEVWALTR